MPVTLSLTEGNLLTALRSFLQSILPASTEIIQGQANRVPEPIGPDYVIYWPILRTRLSTNVDTTEDIIVTGAISGTVLAAATVDGGTLRPGLMVNGAGVATGTRITGMDGATGGVGTYTVTPPQGASGPFYIGSDDALQPTQVTVQLDVHGPASADNTQIISTLMRDDFACQAFTASGFDIQPLYTSEPMQAPFINAEEQVESRWTIDVVLQANPVVYVPQQFADTLSVIGNPPLGGLIDVDQEFPA